MLEEKRYYLVRGPICLRVPKPFRTRAAQDEYGAFLHEHAARPLFPGLTLPYCWGSALLTAACSIRSECALLGESTRHVRGVCQCIPTVHIFMYF